MYIFYELINLWNLPSTFTQLKTGAKMVYSIVPGRQLDKLSFPQKIAASNS